MSRAQIKNEQPKGKPRGPLHTAQRQGLISWAAAADGQPAKAEADYDQRLQRSTAWERTDPVHRRDPHGIIDPDPRHEIQYLGGIADFWYLDDGDILCDPKLVLPFLQQYDAVDATTGGIRNKAKSEVLYYADEATMRSEAAAWRLDEVRALADVRSANESTLTLGVSTGPQEAVQSQMELKCQVVRSMHDRIGMCQDTQSEHVLMSQSLGVGRVNHILRVHGARLCGKDSLKQFDEVTTSAADRLFFGLTPESHAQAALNTKLGGLGWRKASDTALPANLAALLLAEPKVASFAHAATHAGLLPAGVVEGQVAMMITEAKEQYLAQLDEAERAKAIDFIQKVVDSSRAHWQNEMSGRERPTDAPIADALYEGEDAVTALPTDIGSSPEESNHRSLTPQHVQHQLYRLLDCTRLRALERALTAQCNWPQLARLKELRHRDVCHKWLWHLDATNGSVLSEADYVCNVQKRLGALIHANGCSCRLCGKWVDSQLEHCETCSTAEATRGHYAVVRALVDGFRLADPAVTTEPKDLTSTSDRPADILTLAAVPGRSAALDICVTSPNAASARGDAATSAFQRKLARYKRTGTIAELGRAGIAFKPMIWTADGRPHPAAMRCLRFAATAAANKAGVGAAAPQLLSRWRHEVSIAILRRRAAMARAVVPRQTARELWLLTGHREEVAATLWREPELYQLDGLSTEQWQ